ncbi:MAG: Uma2 family endonuclease [Myxococcales bacterium]|nr:Uma2 family endonuclease [Myxococcales bacterium]HQY65539.1 Uma2 family endonuclease [Polyangiaceae bacterium]
MTSAPLRQEGVTYVRAIRPLHFPDSDPEWEMSESHRHKRLCELLYQVLAAVLPGDHASIGADQFVYFDPLDPRRKCAPDGFVKLGVPGESITSWKTWQKGAPELCVEILSPSDTEEKLTLPQKLERFAAMGVLEVVTFDVDAKIGERIRAWESVRGDLVERVVLNERTYSVVLGKWFVVAPYLAEGRPALQRLDAALRLAEDAEGRTLVPTPDELERARAEEERARAEEERARAEEERARAEEDHARAVARIDEERARADAAEAELLRLRAALAERFG